MKAEQLSYFLTAEAAPFRRRAEQPFFLDVPAGRTVEVHLEGGRALVLTQARLSGPLATFHTGDGRPVQWLSLSYAQADAGCSPGPTSRAEPGPELTASKPQPQSQPQPHPQFFRMAALSAGKVTCTTLQLVLHGGGGSSPTSCTRAMFCAAAGASMQDSKPIEGGIPGLAVRLTGYMVPAVQAAV